jgi:PadR family transcriptional regulator, regulatory protein AphA
MPAVRTTEIGSLTTTEAAVLALLAIEGERSGYDLSKRVEGAIAHVWSPARSGLYAVLPRLEHAGLARRRVVSQRPRPDKQLYRITRAGERALQEWLETVEPDATDSFRLKLFVGGLVGPEVMLEQVEQFRLDTAARLERYRAIAATNTDSGHDWYHRHLLRLAIAHAEVDLEWADGVARALARGPR